MEPNNQVRPARSLVAITTEQSQLFIISLYRPYITLISAWPSNGLFMILLKLQKLCTAWDEKIIMNDE
jgi:hypothetical protein